MDSGEKMDAGL